jgi:hypothetical protein
MQTLSSQEVKQTPWEILEQFPPAQRHQALDFARFLYQQVLTPSRPLETTEGVAVPEQKIQPRLVPAGSLVDLTGIVSLGSDAVADTVALLNYPPGSSGGSRASAILAAYAPLKG